MLRQGRFHALISSWHLRLLLVFVLLAHPLAAVAQSWTPWTTVGSAGTVDLYDKDTAVFSSYWVGVNSAAALPATVEVRYNVVSVEGLLQGGGRHNLKVRYIDNGDQARVVVYLKEVDLTTGVVTTRITFDSNLYPSSSSSQTQTVTGGCTFPFPPAPWSYNFESKAYYLETQITKSGSSGNPWLATLALSNQYCVG